MDIFEVLITNITEISDSEKDYLVYEDDDLLPHRTETLRLDGTSIEVYDTYTIEESGRVATYTDAEIDYTEAIFVDEDSNGVIDYVAYDVNHDGILEEGEEFLIEEGELYQSDLDDLYMNHDLDGYDDIADIDIF